MADLTIVVNVRDNQTMSSYKIPPSGRVEFVNAAANQGDLVISPKPPAATLPFCENNGTTPETLPPIPPGGSGETKICGNFAGEEFLYTAQIGTAAPEDPIVIIEKSKLYYWDPAVAAVAGALIGAGITYFIVRSRDSRRRPQQA
jgi:hypothetical protein